MYIPPLVSNNYEAHPLNSRAWDGMPLADVLEQAAIFIENYIGDHVDDYDTDGSDDLYNNDVELAKELRRHLEAIT